MSKRKGVVTKSELSEILGISNRTRAKYMNVILFDELKLLGYQKNSNILNRRVVEFMENEFLLQEYTHEILENRI